MTCCSICQAGILAGFMLLKVQFLLYTMIRTFYDILFGLVTLSTFLPIGFVMPPCPELVPGCVAALHRHRHLCWFVAEILYLQMYKDQARLFRLLHSAKL